MSPQETITAKQVKKRLKNGQMKQLPKSNKSYSNKEKPPTKPKGKEKPRHPPPEAVLIKPAEEDCYALVLKKLK